MTTSILTRKGQPVETPPFINFLFNDKRASMLWLFVRIWLGWQWIESGLEKLENPAWTQTGKALKGFWLEPCRYQQKVGHQSLMIGIATFYSLCLIVALCVVRQTYFGWRIVDRYRVDCRTIRRNYGISGWIHELELYYGRLCQRERRVLWSGSPAGAGLENCRLPWPGLLPAAPHR